MPKDSRNDAALLRPHLTRLYRFAYRLTGGRADAEDLVQDSLVKVFNRQTDLASLDDVGQWLTRVLPPLRALTPEAGGRRSGAG